MSPESVKSRLQNKYNDGAVHVLDLTGTENHYQVEVHSSLFKGLSRIEQHQDVMSVFAEELKTGEVHALSIKTKVL
jgi:stress-induced morphogen